jgi:hypothetical protein
MRRSHPLALGELDKRTNEGRYVETVRKALYDHVGGDPSAPQQLLIGAIALTALRIEFSVKKILDDRQVAEGDDNRHLAWVNSLRRSLVAIGLERRASYLSHSLTICVSSSVAGRSRARRRERLAQYH